MAAKPSRTGAVFWGSVNPLEGKEKALDLMTRQVEDYGREGVSSSTNVRYD